MAGEITPIFLAPFVILLPFYYHTGGISWAQLTRYNMLESPVWIGLTNFKILLMDDDIFLALKNTLVLHS